MNRTNGWIITTVLLCMMFAGNSSKAEDVDVMAEWAAKFFYQPVSVTTDSEGNIYAAGFWSHRIFKITQAGVVTTWVGKPGLKGHADGRGSSASFNFPASVATDKAGNVYVSDSSSDTIRKVTPAGVVMTMAGTADDLGHKDGTGPKASFLGPSGITTDSASNVYVVDNLGYTIRKITASGVVTTLAGTAAVSGHADGAGTAASFDNTHGITSDSTGNLYVADTRNCTIRKITPAGVVTTLAGTAGVIGHADGVGAAASFFFPQDVAADNVGNVYVADSFNGTIRKVTPTGLVTTLAGSPGEAGNTDGTGAEARFASPMGVATDRAGNVYVADAGNNSIRKITPAGVVTTLAHIASRLSNADSTGAKTSLK